MRSSFSLFGHETDARRCAQHFVASGALATYLLFSSVPALVTAAPIVGDYTLASGSATADALYVGDTLSSNNTATISNTGILTLTGGSVDAARVRVGNGSNATGLVSVLSGGRIVIDGSGNTSNPNGPPGLSTTPSSPTGSATVRVDGLGSSITIKGNSGFVNVAGSSGADNGLASLEVTNGGVIEGGGGSNDFVSFNVGGGFSGGVGTGGTGTVLVDGANSRISLKGAFGPGAGLDDNAAQVNIGRGTGTGMVTVFGGGQLTIDTTGVTTDTNPGIAIAAAQSTATGALNVQGANSRVVVTSDGLNPFLTVGRVGTGSLNVTNGALVQLNGNSVSPIDNFTSVSIGATGAGGLGTAVVSGTGSRLEINGANGTLTVGRGVVIPLGQPGSPGVGATGFLSIENGGAVSSPVIALVGIDYGTGTVTMNNGSLAMSGTQQVTGAAANSGPALVLGRRGGTGTLSMTNGSSISIVAPGNDAGFSAISLGGTSTAVQGGTGNLFMSSGSTITMTGGSASGNNALSGVYIGRIGSGTMSVAGTGTSVDVSALAGGGRVMVGVEPFGVNTGTGILTVSDNAIVNAGALLGVAHNGTSSSGGTGTLILNSGGRACAASIYVGNQGTIAGSGGTLCGNVVSNFGVISPGLSPGQLTIEGGYSTLDSGKFLLEIESNGAGGFNLDTIVFKGITAADLNFAGTEFAFSFLGDTNPQEALGDLPLSSFFLFDDGSGLLGIDDALNVSLDALFANTTFTARADNFDISRFVYTPGGGFVAIAASPIPLPGTLALVTIALLGAVANRRRHR